MPGSMTSSTIGVRRASCASVASAWRAVLGDDELVALGLERPHERVAHGGLVLDDQEAHRAGSIAGALQSR